MRLIVGGCRGTAPVAQPAFMRYGGETTSFLIEGGGGEQVLIDAGSGVRLLGQRLAEHGASQPLLLLFTHYHLDHVAGLPSLQLIYSPNWSIEMASPRRGGFLVGDVIPRIMHKPFWPLQVEHLASRLVFSTLRGAESHAPRRHAGLEIRWCPLHHPGGSTAYRFDEPASGSSCVIATDMEWGESSPEERAAFLRFCSTPSPASLLLIDGQYTQDEYPEHRGWGHTTLDEALAIGRETGVERLLITHHAPTREDGELAALETRVRAVAPNVAFARERMEIEVGAP